MKIKQDFSIPQNERVKHFLEKKKKNKIKGSFSEEDQMYLLGKVFDRKELVIGIEMGQGPYHGLPYVEEDYKFERTKGEYIDGGKL